MVIEFNFFYRQLLFWCLQMEPWIVPHCAHDQFWLPKILHHQVLLAKIVKAVELVEVLQTFMHWPLYR